ncbi:hypothetical protein HHI36_007457 [Cryptolaemus montrouzieri]|uniref:UDP-glucuronosyltransferase n=1 Tax=Cryptolaemus montrouzieri TaxID=559131 RepID=A0ABD2MQ15_9CUCU
MKIILLLLIIFCVCEYTKSANILVLIPSPFYSHQATFRPLWRELSKKGHKITLITTDLMEENENITQIDISNVYELTKNNVLIEILQGGIINMIRKGLLMVDNFFKYILTNPDVKELIASDKKFDLFFVELLIPAFSVLSAKFNCPYIGLNSMDPPSFIHSAVGNAIHPSVYPFANLGFGAELSFKERLISTSVLVVMSTMEKIVWPTADRFFRKYIDYDLPDAHHIIRNVSLVFSNANPIFFPAKPITPITINLGGGLHLMEPKKLPKDLQDYLDQSKDGCIYFSLGSTINSNYLSRETIEIFRQTFEELAPMRVLWKYENETLENKPHNLEIRKWLPQHDVLRHPNVKVFITQGGLQSMEEAIDSAVPMLGMPFYGDQKNNVKKMSIKKFGIALDVATIDKKSLKDAILELVDNPLYKKNIEKLSAISKDQPMTGIEKAVWWTEYVLRHGGTEHLRSPSADIPLYQYFFLDIIAFVILVFIVLILLVYYLIKLIRTIFRLVFSKRNKVKTN